ncbi:hypothetical protein C8P68_106229 [Mucilaginibacter yixingensis]|uniref:Uncharacterized protein n=1 Tax=Mucilaginibacter yixingensis TaxID=1295612 RepID=A0A2T5J788_9SPHI|nr:hypothetical protein [Mucilaginibacter yixingensis]PTQ95014.1 hypothetical protein C8P68_106229 [Mucilaginibacter yixingensis]
MYQPVYKIPVFVWIAVGFAFMLMLACRQSTKHQAQSAVKKAPSFKVFPLDAGDGSPVADKMLNPVVMYPCPVYTQPDSASNKFTTLPILTSLQIKGRVERSYKDTVKTGNKPAYLSNASSIWYQVLIKGKQGYISEKNIAKFTFTDSVRKVTYLIGISTRTDTGGAVRAVLKYDLQRQQLLSKVDIPANNSGNFSVVTIKNTTLKNVSYLLRVDENMEYGGGGQTSQLIADGGAGLVAFPQTNIGYDDGDGLRQNVLYVPAKGDDGVLRFYIDGDIYNHWQWSAYYVKAWNAYGKPADEILMYTTQKGQSVLDKNNQPVILKNHQPSLKV